MRYVKARIRTESREMAYRIFITDSLKIIGGLDTRFYDLVSDDFERKRMSDEAIKEKAQSTISHISSKLDSLGKEG